QIKLQDLCLNHVIQEMQQEENTQQKHHAFVQFKKLEILFKISKNSLAKAQKFLQCWPLQSNKEPSRHSKASWVGITKAPPININFDFGNIFVRSKISSSIFLHYEIQKIIASFVHNNDVMAHSCLKIIEHNVKFVKKLKGHKEKVSSF